MADGDDQHDKFRLLKLANDAVVAHSVTPESELAMPERLAKAARILGFGDALVHEVEDFTLDLAVEFLEVADRFPGRIQSSRPSCLRTWALVKRLPRFSSRASAR